MIVRFVALAILLSCMYANPAAADDGPVTPGDDDFNVVIEHVQIGDSFDGHSSGNGGHSGAVEVSDYCATHELCAANLVCEPSTNSPLGGVLVYYDGGPGLNLGWCDPGGNTPPTVTPSAVLNAFRNIPLPASQLSVQPPNGRTLVNFDTNFYTEQGPFTRTVQLLGQSVELRIWPSQYRWVFGDGADLASASAGAPYPDLLITHHYRRAGSVSPRVDTTYAAQFSVNGGPWRDVDGTVTIPGSPVGLDVTTAGPVLVGYH